MTTAYRGLQLALALTGLLVMLLIWRPLRIDEPATTDDGSRQGGLEPAANDVTARGEHEHDRYHHAPWLGGATVAGGIPDAFEPTPSRLTPGRADGTIRLDPDHMSAAQVGTYAVRFTVGAEGIATGGGVLIDIAKAWFTRLYPVAKPFQQRRPDAAHFVSATASRRDVELSLELQHRNFDGKTSRYPHMTAVTVERGRLFPGDEITLTLHNTTAPFIAGEDEIWAAVNPHRGGPGLRRLVSRPAVYRVEAAPATDFALFGPSQAVLDEPVELQLTAFDHFGNLSRARGAVTVEGLRTPPLPPSTGSLGSGIVRFHWVPRHAGFHWPEAVLHLEGPDGPSTRRVAGDPIRVFADPPTERIFWGDLHSHSAISKDAVGHDDFRYARDVTRLDFLAPTEHSEDDVHWRHENDGITPAEWQKIRRRVRRFYEPGRFVTLLGYECTLHDGHHCVYFRSDEGVPWNPRRLGDVGNLWERLAPGAAFTIPHHLGRTTGAYWSEIEQSPELRPPPAHQPRQQGPWVDWRQPGPVLAELRPSLEIYSLHGSSEYEDPDDPLAYNNVGFLPSVPRAGLYYARDAWALGHRVGTVAGSDNHTAQPGRPHGGLTAVRAPGLEREAIFDAIMARQTYATTGRRIYLEFEVAGTRMGGSGTSESEITGHVLLAAPGRIASARVLRYSDDRTGWQVAQKWRDVDRLLDASFVDHAEPGERLYYLRAELAEPTGGRTVRAWSSPIWLDIRP